MLVLSSGDKEESVSSVFIEGSKVDVELKVFEVKVVGDVIGVKENEK